MNKLTGALVVLIVLVGSFFILNTYIYNEKQADEAVYETPERDVYLNQFEESVIQIAFDYPDGSDGYVIDDVSSLAREESQEIEVIRAYRIINAKEKFELENSQDAREGPPTMQLTVFQNDLNQSAGAWVDAFPFFSNIDMVLGAVDRDARVGGANAVRYTIDGLYLTDNVVVASGDYIYHFTGSYLERDSAIRQDFQAIIDSVRFIPPAGPSGDRSAKIDVQVACESALTYMLFQTGEQSEQFVAECVAGEHPDVIERYINDLGLDVATI